VQRLELARAENEPVAFSERVTFPGELCDDEIIAVEDVVISGTVERSGNGFLLEGEVAGEARLRCGRCLREFPHKISERMSVRLLPATQAPRDEELQLHRADLEVMFYDEPSVDLGEIATEQVELAVPTKPLCQDTCQGLCPRCGADMNLGRCGCPRPTDPRWQPLKEWRKRG